MLPEKYAWIGVQFEPEGDPWGLYGVAVELEQQGQLEAAATVYDRAFGLDPSADRIRQARARLLERLAIEEHGLVFRYVPGGVFLMGRQGGEPDEGPWHPVWLRPFWMSETPVSWADYTRLLDWTEPPRSFPRDLQPQPADFERDRRPFYLHEANKVRWSYYKVHDRSQDDDGPSANGPYRYDNRPMVAVGWAEALELADHLSTDEVRYGLPTEAQWEKAARGGLIGARHAWGNQPPDPTRCDFDRFRDFSIQPMTTFAPNGYGLYAMCGGVWEWTADWYDRDYYRASPERDPTGPAKGQEKVLRGGSWADCADVVTVTFRMSRRSGSWRNAEWGGHLSPTIGFRLCRTTH
jgi:formylglycine-generating enzyme required for sulfatase activity